MKLFCYMTLITFAAAGTLCAQSNAIANAGTGVNASTNTNTNAVSQILALVTTNAPSSRPQPRGPTRIESDSVDFDLTKREATYRGHVRVDDPQMKLSCGWLVADLPQAGGRINHIVAETNVVIDATNDKGQTIHATADKAVYVYNVQAGVTNDTVTLTGHPELSNVQGTSTGDVIVWNRAGNHVEIKNPIIVTRQNLGGTLPGTNAPERKTNSMMGATRSPTANSPTVKTNSTVVRAKPTPAITNQTVRPK